MDNLNRLIEKLHKRERIFGYTAYIPAIYTLAEYMPEGVDYILFDCEHGPNDVDHYSDYFRLCRMLDIPTIVRVPDAVYHSVARAIDCGADGILVPRVESVEQMEAVIEGLRMPPLGRKGFGGKFQLYPGETIGQFNRRRLLWIQIESEKGTEVLPEILKLYGSEISACVIGPCDLTISVNGCADSDSAGVVQMLCQNAQDIISRTGELCEQYNISFGSYCFDENGAAKNIALGMNLLWVGCDANYLLRGIKNAAETVAKL